MIGQVQLRTLIIVCSSTLVFATANLSHAQEVRDATTTGTSRAFNPAISLNALMLGHLKTGENELGSGEHHHGLAEGLLIQEMELRFTSDVDPYSKADATIAYHEGVFHVEEVFVRTHRLPAGLGLKVGRMYVPLSNENALHTHNLPFVRRSLVLSEIAPDGMTDVGAELRYLTSLPFYTELRMGVFDGGKGEAHPEASVDSTAAVEAEGHAHGSIFNAPDGENLVYHAGLATLFELGENTTFQFDAAYTHGRNGLSLDNDTFTQITSSAATVRWKPARNATRRGFRLSTEFTYVDEESSDPDHPSTFMSGWSTYAQLQFARRWWVQAMHETLDPARVDDDSWRVGALLAFVASEFQAIRFEISQVNTPDDDFTEFWVQYNVTIGSHPAHRY